MKKDLTELVFILDRSGSMAGLESDTIGGFNAMLEKQRKQEGEVLVSTVLFNQESTVLHDRKKLEDISPLTEEDYQVGGCTALIDAIGDSVHHIRTVHRYIREEDIPEHTLFVITTDGLENASHKYDSKTVKNMVKEQQEKGWNFLFLGANIDAVETAGHFGIDKNFAANFRNDSLGIATNFCSLGAAICGLRADGVLSKNWKKNIEANFKKK